MASQYHDVIDVPNRLAVLVRVLAKKLAGSAG
jgi:hypothetical protein